MQRGRRPEAIFADPVTGATTREFLSDVRCTGAYLAEFKGSFADDASGTVLVKRQGIDNTLHRLAIITHPLRVARDLGNNILGGV